jgi:hypothetical protein
MPEPIKPVFPRWASETVLNPISSEANVYEPPEQKKDLGWDLYDVPPRQYFNWLERQTGLALEYLDYHSNRPKIYTIDTLPAAADNVAQIVFVSDSNGGILAYSNGTVWKNVTTGNTVV